MHTTVLEDKSRLQTKACKSVPPHPLPRDASSTLCSLGGICVFVETKQVGKRWMQKSSKIFKSDYSQALNRLQVYSNENGDMVRLISSCYDRTERV